MNIGLAIRTLRKERGITQKKLAFDCDLSANALSQIEIGESFPHKENINKICKVLNIPISYLLFFSIDDEDVPETKRAEFKSLNNALRTVLIDSIHDHYKIKDHVSE